MKKILLGLFILGTLGMAQGNYKINVKNGVKFSQSEIDQESKEIENIVNRDLFEKVNDAFQKKILVKVREFNKQYMDNLINESMKEVPQNQRQSFKEFMRNISNIINNTLITKDIFETDIKSISFSGENDAKVKILIKTKNIDSTFNFGKFFDSSIRKSEISEEESNDLRKIDKNKLDAFYKYLEDDIKEFVKKSSYEEENIDVKVNKVNGKWQLELKNANINEVFDNLGEVFDVVNYKN